MIKAKLIQPLLVLFVALFLMVGLTGCTGALTSGASSGSSSSSSSSDSSYVDEEEDYEDDPIFDDDMFRDDKEGSSASSSSTSSSDSSSASSSASSSISEYGTLDPDWRSSCVNGYRVFDVSAVDDWQSPPPEVQDLVDRIEARYDLGLEFVDVKEDSGGWRYYFQDADAQDDPYGGDSLSIKVMPGSGMYAAMGLYCVDADDVVGVSEMVAEVFGFDTYPIDEVADIFSDPNADEGSQNHYEGGPVYEWAYCKEPGEVPLKKAFRLLDLRLLRAHLA